MDSITTYTMQVIIHHYKVLDTHSQHLPMMHQVTCCKVYCKEVLEIGYDVWAKGVVPLLPMESIFNVEVPACGQTHVARLALYNGDLKKSVEMWQASCLMNKFWKALSDMSDEEVCKDFVHMATAFLGEMEKVNFGDLSQEALLPFTAVIKCF